MFFVKKIPPLITGILIFVALFAPAASEALYTVHGISPFGSSAGVLQQAASPLFSIFKDLSASVKSFPVGEVKKSTSLPVSHVIPGKKEIIFPGTIHLSSEQCRWLWRTIRSGMRGEDVKRLQELLKEQGFYTYPVATGYFGPATARAVRAFQKAHHLISSPASAGAGIVGPQTRRLLKKLCGPEPLPIPTPVACTQEYDPVCAQPKQICPPCKSGICPLYVACPMVAPRTYPNACVARSEGATILRKGKCEGSILPVPIITEDPVIQEISGPTELRAGEEGVWTVRVKNKPGTGEGLRYIWDWGDEPDVWALSAPQNMKMSAFVASEASATHRYHTPGTYTIMVTVINQSGGKSKATIQVHVRKQIDDNSISVRCRTWTDGCNVCTRIEPNGPGLCTQRYCSVLEQFSAKRCLSYFPGTVTPFPQPKIIKLSATPSAPSVTDDSLIIKWKTQAAIPWATGKKYGLALVLRDVDTDSAYKSVIADLNSEYIRMNLRSDCNDYFSDAIDSSCRALTAVRKKGTRFIIEAQLYTPKDACFGYCAPDSPRPHILQTVSSNAFSLPR